MHISIVTYDTTHMKMVIDVHVDNNYCNND